MLTGIHFLTSYACNFECEHCFLHSGPRAGGTFTVAQVRRLLDQAVRVGTIRSVCFEGGEPLLFYPLVLAGLEMARERGFAGGIVTNAYWATSVGDAELWLRPLAERGVASVTISDDPLHYGEQAGLRARRVKTAARRVGMSARVIRTNRPRVLARSRGCSAGLDDGGVMFRGRAAERLAPGLPTRPAESLDRCPHENLADPGRVHVDCFGHVHLCQGISMGNWLKTPLWKLVRDYDPRAHPIVGPLLAGGPIELARRYGVPVGPGYVDECHLCYLVRRALLDRFPDHLAPRQVYGMESCLSARFPPIMTGNEPLSVSTTAMSDGAQPRN